MLGYCGLLCLNIYRCVFLCIFLFICSLYLVIKVFPSRLVTGKRGIFTCRVPDADAMLNIEKTKMNKCHQCGFVTDDYHQLILHIVSHKDSMNEAEVSNTKNHQDVGAKSSRIISGSNRSFTEKDGVYVCNICGYDCESQRVIKAHMWKHSGHKDLSYPTFQNGPLSVYDGTLLEAKNFVNKDRESVKALFQQRKQKGNNHEGRESPNGVSTAKKYLEDICNNNKSPNPKDSDLTPPAPKVIVQRIHQTDPISPSSYPTSMEYSNPITPAEPVSTATVNEETDITAVDERPLAENPLQVMTAVCEAVSSQPAETAQSDKPSSNVQQWSASEKTAATLLSLLHQGMLAWQSVLLSNRIWQKNLHHKFG